MTVPDDRRALFVYIPTYNRPTTLRQQLDALTAQRGDWPGEMRILVSDNASAWYSDEVAESMRQGYGVEVRGNPGNIQANANIALGFVFARPGEYLWILADDDIVGDGAVRAIGTEGLAGDPDVITFETTSTEPHSVVHQWQEGWDWVGEMGLVSNVIYKSDVVAPHASQAFFYHNSSFPHLAVLMTTMRERGAMSFRVLPSASVLLPRTSYGEEAGAYALSLSGMPLLAPLLPPEAAGRFCRDWLREQGRGFVEHRDVHPDVHLATRAVLRKYGGLRATVMLRWLLWTQPLLRRRQQALALLSRSPVKRLVPAAIRRLLRAHL